VFVTIQLKFQDRTFRRSATIDLDQLPSSAHEMPNVIHGKVIFQNADLFTMERSKIKTAIFNETQVHYKLEISDDDGTFTARRHSRYGRLLRALHLVKAMLIPNAEDLVSSKPGHIELKR
jgi:hypothetical protein